MWQWCPSGGFSTPTAAEFIAQRWKPRQMIAPHLATNDGAYAEQLRKKFPQV